jgi:DNA-binding CsgD family transcriptional regulator
VPDPGAAQAFATHAGENPLVAYQHATGDPAPVRLSDFVTNREFRRRPIYALVYRPIGVEYQLAFGGGVEPGRVSGVALNRQHRDFSERDVEVLGLLCPLLNQITATVARSAGCPGAQDVAQLTPRQRELLARLAAGATNAQIAAELGISARTVAKHLEHVYEALGVSNRTAAAARWRAVRGAPY